MKKITGILTITLILFSTCNSTFLNKPIKKTNHIDWLQNFNIQNAILSSFKHLSLTPIYKLFETSPFNNNEFNQYCKQFIHIANSKQTIYMSPVYSLYMNGGGTKSDHILTLDPSSEIGNKLINEGILFPAYNYQKLGTTPIHRFYKHRIRNHFFTMNPDYGSLQAMGYQYEGIAFYAFPNFYFTPEGQLRPIYRYWSDKYMDHYYSPRSITPMNYIPEGVAFYVPY